MKTLINDITVSYIEHGSSQGLPVVFIHGFPFSRKMWEPQMLELPNDILAIAYDVRGHGFSDVGDGQFTIELFVDDLIVLLDHLGIEKAVLCGLSMGGYIALRAIERHPNRIKGLLLCDTKSEPDTSDEKIKRANSIKTIKSAGVSAFAENFVKAVFWPKTFEKNPGAIEFIKELVRANSALGICGTLLALASRTDTTQSLSSIDIPTCIIVGEYDLLTPPSCAQRMHEAIAGSELHILSNASHMSNLENIKDFNKRLTDFLKKHW
ncbi:MAG: alpha/beta fold hydrolase [Bacteroidota bacterium]|jgi:pimeloyl-ACP methyl ester carboxylesterase